MDVQIPTDESAFRDLALWTRSNRDKISRHFELINDIEEQFKTKQHEKQIGHSSSTDDMLLEILFIGPVLTYNHVTEKISFSSTKISGFDAIFCPCGWMGLVSATVVSWASTETQTIKKTKVTLVQHSSRISLSLSLRFSSRNIGRKAC